MKRLFLLVIISLMCLSTGVLPAQNKAKATFETIYRPVYGYIIDTLTNQPLVGVKVYAFDSSDDAALGKDALLKSRNPMTVKLKGDVVETLTDESGRYMVPARSTGALVFHIAAKGEIVLEEIAGRSEVSKGRRQVETSYDFDISSILGDDFGRESRRVRRNGPEGVVLEMDFKAHIPQPGERGKDSRVFIERRVTDMETGEVLSSSVPVVRDGRKFHKQRRKLVSKSELTDTLYDIAERFPVLSDSTGSIKVVDRVDTEPWKDRCFRIGYFVSAEYAGEIKPLDTLYVMTNRVDKPLKYLEYNLDPYLWEIEETTEQRRAVTRRLVLEGEYDGRIPDVLKDSSYVLRELHIKASVGQDRPYAECISLADSMVAEVMSELRTVFADKLGDDVRITKTSQVVQEQSFVNKVGYRYVFSTGRQFSKNEYLRLFRRAKDDDRLEDLCRQAMEECLILEKVSWDYAANLLASVYIRQGRFDTGLLAPFVDSPEGCRMEIKANQVLMLMLSEDFEQAASLAGQLPDEYASLREVAGCMTGTVPSDDDSRRLVGESSLRNKILMDMLAGQVTDSTLSLLEEMPQDEAMTWYLKARAHCMMNENEFSADPYVVDCLRKCFEAAPEMVSAAKFDSEINEYSLKEVLGVYVL